MDLIQKVATFALLTLFVYFVMVNIIDNKKTVIKSSGVVNLKSKHEQDRELNAEEHRAKLGPPSHVQPRFTDDTQHAVFNENNTGVVPVNHDLFDSPVDFGSNVTDVNNFYKSNPELFERTMSSVADVDGWQKQSDALFSMISNEPRNKEILPANFERGT